MSTNRCLYDNCRTNWLKQGSSSLWVENRRILEIPARTIRSMWSLSKDELQRGLRLEKVCELSMVVLSVCLAQNFLNILYPQCASIFQHIMIYIYIYINTCISANKCMHMDHYVSCTEHVSECTSYIPAIYTS